MKGCRALSGEGGANTVAEASAAPPLIVAAHQGDGEQEGEGGDNSEGGHFGVSLSVPWDT